MSTWIVVVSLVVLGRARAETPATSADVVTLRDGREALGQVVDSEPRGAVVLLVRRAWAEAELPEWARRWRAAEAPLVRQARRERRDRLAGWRAERSAALGRGDRILAWIDLELARLADPGPPETPLMAVRLGRGDVRSIARQAEPTRRLLRLGWLTEVEDVEAIDPTDLILLLGEAVRGDDPASVEPLLPLYPEPEERWRLRRAATEVEYDPGARFVRFRQLTLPERAPGDPGDPPPPSGLIQDTPAALQTFLSLIDFAPGDPPVDLFRAVEARGGIALIVSRVDLSRDLDGASARRTLWVRADRGRWTPSLTRSSSLQAAEPRLAEVSPRAGIPQLPLSLFVVGSVSSTPLTLEQTRESGAAALLGQEALGHARDLLARDLEPLTLPITPATTRAVQRPLQP